MSQIEELQQRIAVALERIGTGIESHQGKGGASQDELDAAKQALEEEQLANEQLRERIKKLRNDREQLEEQVSEVRAGASDAARKFDTELQSLRAANEQLRDINTKLREAHENAVAEASFGPYRQPSIGLPAMWFGLARQPVALAQWADVPAEWAAAWLLVAAETSHDETLELRRDRRVRRSRTRHRRTRA